MQAIGSGPIGQGGGQGLHRFGSAVLELMDLFEELGNELAALIFGLVFMVHEVAELVHFLVEGVEDRMGGEEFFQSRSLLWIESFGGFAEGGEVAAVVLEIGD